MVFPFREKVPSKEFGLQAKAVIEQEAMLNAAKVLIRMFMVFIYSKLR